MASNDDWAKILEPPKDGKPSFTPRVGSEPYTRKDYWEYRFSQEESYEWLCGYSSFKGRIAQYLPNKSARILLVGSGNSSLPSDLAADGYTGIAATDYSSAVVERMSAKMRDSCPGVEWSVADMTNLSDFGDESFDCVLDKAAMDAILADGGDTWDPPENLLAVAEKVVSETARVLKPGGVYLQLTFSQPHFRKKYLLQHPSRWEAFASHTIPAGFGYYLFAMRKPTPTTGPTVQ